MIAEIKSVLTIHKMVSCQETKHDDRYKKALPPHLGGRGGYLRGGCLVLSFTGLIINPAITLHILVIILIALYKGLA